MNEKITTCLNGAFVMAEEAHINVADRGFRFGDGVFESIRLEAGIPYQWELHMARLHAGLTALRITPPATDWQHVTLELIQRNHAKTGSLRIAVSRGVGSIGYLPAAGITPTWVIEYLPPTTPSTEPHKLCVSSISRPPLSALPVHFKLAHGISSTMALMEAQEQGCTETIMLTTDGKLCEAASANLFWVINQKIYTPHLSTGCLDGTTRAALLRLTPIEETISDLGSLHSADAIFLTNARRGIVPADCARFRVQGSVHHPRIRQLHEQLTADRATYAQTHQADWA